MPHALVTAKENIADVLTLIDPITLSDRVWSTQAANTYTYFHFHMLFS